MTDISVVVVTGASGFIGSHIVRECLERGFTVNACVRNKDDPKNQFLIDMAKDIGKGKIQLFSADVVTKGAYDEAVSNADGVIHAAAQVDPGSVKDPWKDMVEPSTEGVKNILSSVNKFNVKHYVQTSSMSAVASADSKPPLTEENWSNWSIKDYAYGYAKTEAEKLVWSETKGKSYTVSCIMPAMVWGPSLAAPHVKASPFVFRQALLGKKQPNSNYSSVDVRDVAKAHVEALIRPEANGKRFIIDGDEPNIAINDVLKKCREMFPQYVFDDAPGPKGWSVKLFGYKQPTRSTTDNTRSKQVLGINYIPMEKTFYDSVESMVKKGFVQTRPVSKL